MGAFSGDLFVAGALPVIRVVIMAAVGAIMARRGLFGPEARRNLSALVFNVFVPSLIFIKLLPSISPGKVPDWWPILVVPVVAVVLGVALGWLTCLVLRLPREVWGIVLVATALSNMGNLPLVLVQSLAEDPNSPLFGMGELAIAYVAFALIFVTLSHFSIGFYLLKPPPLPAAHKSPSRSAVAPPSRVGSETDSAAPSPPSSPRLPTPGARAGRSDRADSADGRAMSGEALEVEQAAAAEPMDRLPYDVVLPDRYEERRGGYRIFIQRIVKSMRPGRGKKRPGGITMRDILTPPTVGCFLAVILGFIPPIKRALVLELEEDVGDREPVLDVVGKTIATLGDAAIPCMMLVLGGALQTGPPKGTRLPTLAGIGIIVVKLLVLPAVGTLLLFGVVKAGLFDVPDPAFLFVCLCMFPVPTAINMQTIANIHRNGVEELANTMFWQYLLSMVTLPLWMALFLWMSSRAADGRL